MRVLQLDLSENMLDAEAAKTLAPAIAGSDSLTKLVIWGQRDVGDEARDEGEAAIKEAVRGKEGFELDM